jgi:uncharacterized protein
MNRRQFIKRSAYAAVITGGGAAWWGRHELHQLSIERIPLRLKLGPEAPANLSVAQLSDFHIDPQYDEAWIARYVNETNALKPDVIALTGDFVTKDASALVPLAAHLGKLQAPGGVFACLGNHDQWNMSLFKFRQTFESVGIRVLINEAAAVTLRDRKVWLAGVESVWAGYPNPAKSLSALKSHERAIFLAHEPDYALDISRQLPIALQLSGHTHGGQICLPPGKVILSPRHGKILVRGIYQDSAAWPVYVNRGIGTLGPHFRVACRPEITLLQIENVS